MKEIAVRVSDVYISYHNISNHFPLVRFGAMGWGKPPLPQTPADIPDYLRSVKCKAPFQDWIYDTIDILQEDEAYTIEDYKIREYTTMTCS